MKFLSPFRLKDFFVISHEHNDSFLKWFGPNKFQGACSDWPRINPFFSKNLNLGPKHKIPKNQWEKLNRFHYCQISKFWFFLKVPYFFRNKQEYSFRISFIPSHCILCLFPWSLSYFVFEELNCHSTMEWYPFTRSILNFLCLDFQKIKVAKSQNVLIFYSIFKETKEKEAIWIFVIGCL